MVKDPSVGCMRLTLHVNYVFNLLNHIRGGVDGMHLYVF
jgi:hypothetical protein